MWGGEVALMSCQLHFMAAPVLGSVSGQLRPVGRSLWEAVEGCEKPCL